MKNFSILVSTKLAVHVFAASGVILYLFALLPESSISPQNNVQLPTITAVSNVVLLIEKKNASSRTVKGVPWLIG